MEMYKGCPKGHPGPKGMKYMSMLEAYEFVSKSLGVNREDIPEFDSFEELFSWYHSSMNSKKGFDVCIEHMDGTNSHKLSITWK